MICMNIHVGEIGLTVICRWQCCKSQDLLDDFFVLFTGLSRADVQQVFVSISCMCYSEHNVCVTVICTGWPVERLFYFVLCTDSCTAVLQHGNVDY